MKCKHESYLRCSMFILKHRGISFKKNKRKMNDLEPELRFIRIVSVCDNQCC